MGANGARPELGHISARAARAETGNGQAIRGGEGCRRKRETTRAIPAYDVQLEVEIRNTGEAPRSLAYRLDGPTGMPLEGWWFAHKISQRWFSAAGLRDVAVRFAGSPELQIDCPLIVQGKVEPMGDGQALAYAGVDGQYFSAVLIPKIASLEDVWFDTIQAILVGPKPDPHVPATYANVTCRLDRKPIELAAGASHKDSYRVFIGPKRPELLAHYYPANDPSYSLKDLLYFGWPIFAAVAKLMLAILHFFYSIVGNYGIAIMLLTVLVRGAMFPISFRQTQNMARIQALKPEMDRINEKYKIRHAEEVGRDPRVVSQAQDQSTRRLLAGVFAAAGIHWAVSSAVGGCRIAPVAAV